jgi:CubicO group peptidase (beta-lactamase class C family)
MLWTIVLRIFGAVLALVLGLAGLFFAMMPRAPKPPGQVETVEDLERYLEQVTGQSIPPGLSLAVVKDGRLVYNRGFGMADGPRGLAAGPDTVYHWWSMTKIPTAIAILQLQERGLLSIDDPVTRYLPFFQVTYPTDQQPPITLRHLLNHSSGLKDNVPEIIGWVHWEGDPPRSQTELLREKLPAYAALAFTPGERAQYTNVGYMVLGAVIEAVSGQSYEAYIQANILAPLKMAHTGFVVSESMAGSEAAGTQHVANAFTPLMIPLVDMNAMVRERQGLRLWFNRVYNDQTPPTAGLSQRRRAGGGAHPLARVDGYPDQ